MDFTGKMVLVIGLGRTGASVARCIATRGGYVRVAEHLSDNALQPMLRQLEGVPLEISRADDPDELLRDIDLVIPSPGVPATSPLLAEAVRRKLPVWSEIELAYRLVRCPILAVTGTNGKSTTTTLLGEMVRQSGRATFIGGNLGTPLIEVARPAQFAQPAQSAPEVAVAEISSFQLEWVEQFRPQIGVFLNLSEDHLDRHGSLAGYGAAKRRMFEQQRQSDWIVINRDDPNVHSLCQDLPGLRFSFGWLPLADDNAHGAWVDGGHIVVRHAGQEVFYPLAGVRLRGRHNLANVMAAAGAATLYGVPSDVIRAALAAFSGLPHRLELVAEKDGVAYINDSKGTNVDAVVQSLRSCSGPVILLAGGVEKGGDYHPLRALLRTKVKQLILFGQAQQLLQTALGRETDTLLVEELDDAVRAARRGAQAGDTVLLSPACASFDQFRNYAHRGEAFRAYVEAL